MDQELIVAILACFLSVTGWVVLQYWFGQKAECVGNTYSIRHRRRYIDWGQTGTSQYNTDLYVESFGDEYDEIQLEEDFVRFGNINSWEMINMKDKTGRSRKVGFVSYELHESAALAAKELNGKVTRIIPLQNRMACVEQLLRGKELSPGVTVRVMNYI